MSDLSQHRVAHAARLDHQLGGVMIFGCWALRRDQRSWRLRQSLIAIG